MNYQSRQNKYSKGNNRQTYKKSSSSAANGSKGRNFNGNTPNNFKRANGKRPYKKQNRVPNKPSVKIAFLGGLNEIGKNITLIECENDIVIVDCGMAFPDGDMLGVDLVIPDFSYIEQNFDKVKGIVLTHGHEDH
ncbi:MAG TPA: RNase J family beta-CASP ribonuclease, partial [Ruminococcus sp.]|nr:RNase J family beta-CASP ribonuclease [Ruminococcus sp.]